MKPWLTNEILYDLRMIVGLTGSSHDLELSRLFLEPMTSIVHGQIDLLTPFGLRVEFQGQGGIVH